jgi:hypothetical protein
MPSVSLLQTPTRLRSTHRVCCQQPTRLKRLHYDGLSVIASIRLICFPSATVTFAEVALQMTVVDLDPGV